MSLVEIRKTPAPVRYAALALSTFLLGVVIDGIPPVGIPFENDPHKARVELYSASLDLTYQPARVVDAFLIPAICVNPDRSVISLRNAAANWPPLVEEASSLIEAIKRKRDVKCDTSFNRERHLLDSIRTRLGI